MNKTWITKVALALALLITVYNFFIIDAPDHKGTGIVLILLIFASVQTSLKS